MQRRINGNRTVRASIGKWGEMSANKAQKLAASDLVKLRDHRDLIEEKKIKRVKNEIEKITLKEIFDAYMIKRAKRLKDNGEIGLRSATKKLYNGLMRLCIGRDISKDGSGYDLATMPIVAITKAMIAKKLEILVTEPGIRGSRAAQAAQCFRLLRALFIFAAGEYEVDGRPLVKIDWVKKISEESRYKTKVRNTIISENELQDWYKAVLKVANPVLRDYILWLAFTGMRRTEAITLRLSDIDFRNKSVKIRAEVAKTGIERVLPLTSVLASLVASRKHDKNAASIITLNPYLFKGRKIGKHIHEPKRAVAAMCKAIDKQWSLHDLRRSYATHGSKLIPYSALKTLLGHSTGKSDITEQYVNLDLESLRPEAEKLAGWLADKMGMEDNLPQVINN